MEKDLEEGCDLFPVYVNRFFSGQLSCAELIDLDEPRPRVATIVQPEHSDANTSNLDVIANASDLHQRVANQETEINRLIPEINRLKEIIAKNKPQPNDASTSSEHSEEQFMQFQNFCRQILGAPKSTKHYFYSIFDRWFV